MNYSIFIHTFSVMRHCLIFIKIFCTNLRQFSSLFLQNRLTFLWITRALSKVVRRLAPLLADPSPQSIAGCVRTNLKEEAQYLRSFGASRNTFRISKKLHSAVESELNCQRKKKWQSLFCRRVQCDPKHRVGSNSKAQCNTVRFSKITNCGY